MGGGDDQKQKYELASANTVGQCHKNTQSSSIIQLILTCIAYFNVFVLWLGIGDMS